MKIKFPKATPVASDHCRKLRKVHATLPAGLQGVAMGIDPGVNFGITLIRNDRATVYNGTLAKQTEPGMYGVLARSFLENYFGKQSGTCIIEGAAFGAQYGQVLLSEVRSGFYIAAKDIGFEKVLMGWRVNYDRALVRLCMLTIAPASPWSSDRIPARDAA